LKEVLIAYGSRYGSTEEIASKISEILEEKNLKTTLINLKSFKSKDSFNFDAFDGILIGSGIKIGKWTKTARLFLEYIKDKSIDKNKVLGIFISSGEAGNAERIPNVRENYIENVLKETEIKVDLYDAFGGVIDLSQNSELGFLVKKMIKMAAKKDPNLKDGERNDGRDWNQINNFAEEFAKLINSKR
jgi:menaquinone-dependent protoporphyrinogen oxidase